MHHTFTTPLSIYFSLSLPLSLVPLTLFLSLALPLILFISSYILNIFHLEVIKVKGRILSSTELISFPSVCKHFPNLGKDWSVLIFQIRKACMPALKIKILGLNAGHATHVIYTNFLAHQVCIWCFLVIDNNCF